MLLVKMDVWFEQNGLVHKFGKRFLGPSDSSTSVKSSVVEKEDTI